MTSTQQPTAGPTLGLVFAALGAGAAVSFGSVLPGVSPLLLAIVLGIVAANTNAVTSVTRPGLAIASTTVLRLGVALLGLQLLLSDILGLGAGVLLVVVAVVAGGIVGTLALGKLLGISPTQRLLIACGSSICGGAAVAAVNGVIKAKEEEVAAAIGCVVVLGTLLIPGLPFVATLIGLPDKAAGIWAGASIHEVAQVVAAGGTIGGSALAVAVVVKLARVVLLAPVLAAVSINQRRQVEHAGPRPPLVPLFILGFAACVAIRSAGIVPDVALSGASYLQHFALAMGMFALGAGLSIDVLRRISGRACLLAVAAAVLVAAIALGGILLVA